MRESTIQIVKATAPVLQDTAEQITKVFYGIMLEEFPEVRPLFNEAHQADGTQPRALAGAIIGYANFIDDPQMLSDALWRAANKHASLFVLPHQYDIVGQCLLRAIGKVLGDAATPDIVDAWAEAYGYLANLLIDIEEYIYRVNENNPGGWRGTRRFRVARRQAESENITSFYLVPVDEGALPVFRPGQYVTFDLVIDGQPVRRNYSLSCAPDSGYLRVSVKHEPGGLVSGYFHERVQEGHELDVYPPCGDFILDDSVEPLVLVSAGVGITPTISMLDYAVHTGRDIVFLHATQNRQVHAFREHVQSLAALYPQVRYAFVYEEGDTDGADAAQHIGVIDTELLARYLPDESDEFELYFLGSKPFMQSIYQAAAELGVPDERIHYEFFGPAQELTRATQAAAAQASDGSAG